MANENHLRILLKGVEAWNEWRDKNPQSNPDLDGARISSMRIPPPFSSTDNLNRDSGRIFFNDYGPTDLSEANFRATFLPRVDLRGVILNGADLTGANLNGAKVGNAKFNNAKLKNANLTSTDLTESDLSGADATGAIFSNTNFTGAKLEATDFNNAKMEWCHFSNNDLSSTKNLELVHHSGPSEISISTLYKSGGRISELFLRGCGVPDEFITYLPSIISARQAIDFYSCFISFSFKDNDFCKRLHSRLRDSHVRVWYAPEDVRGGQKLHEQIDTAIRYFDKLLIVLSENSLNSEWVITEIRKARKAEKRESRRKLFPIRLVGFERIQEWECFDADTGKDLATEVREYFIPDFSNWKNYDAFEEAFERLLRDLKAEEPRTGRV